MTTGRINQVSTSARALNEHERESATPSAAGCLRAQERTVNSRRRPTQARAASQLWSRPLFTKRNGTSGRPRKTKSDRSTAAFGARVTRTHALRRLQPLGMSLRIRIRLPFRWPAPNKPTTDALKRQGPAKQPGTIAPELLPDREANVNGSRKTGR